MITGPVVLKIDLTPSSTLLPSAWNSGPRWSMVGLSMARRMRSGTGVGPGICRKWRPAVRDLFWGMGFCSGLKGRVREATRDPCDDYARLAHMTKVLDQ